MEEGKLKARIEALTAFYSEKKRMPSFAELGEAAGLKSKNAVSKLVTKFEKMNLLKKDEKGKLVPVSLINFTGIKLLGTVEAGFPSPAEEELADILSLDEFLITNRSATFMLKVSGDSMFEAGIIPGDMVLVDKSLSPKSGDIVIACVDDQWTMKFLRKRGGSVTLVPANPAYKPIKPKKELRIAGVVTSVVRKYR